MTKIKRPKELPGKTREIETGCGSLYITINRLDNKPVEVFIRMGKQGSCIGCHVESLGRVITLGLKYGVPLEEYSHHLENIRCNSPHMYPEEERTLSCADAVAKVLKEETKEEVN